VTGAEVISTPAPAAVSGLGSGVTAITGGYEHACALASGGGVQCWGNNHFGQIGDGTTDEAKLPTAVSGLGSGIKAIAAGDFHVCALSASAHVSCWGANDKGQLGDGSTTERHLPTSVPTLGP
jgi:alpha-tubulin suppressor-like RCC1 family protein